MKILDKLKCIVYIILKLSKMSYCVFVIFSCFIKPVSLSHDAFGKQPMGSRLQDGNVSMRWCTAAIKSRKKKNFLVRFKNTSDANQGMSEVHAAPLSLTAAHQSNMTNWLKTTGLKKNVAKQVQGGWGWHVAHANCLWALQKYRNNTKAKNQAFMISVKITANLKEYWTVCIAFATSTKCHLGATRWNQTLL